MTAAPGQPDFQVELEQKLDVSGRRSFSALCIILVTLIIIDLIYFVVLSPPELWDVAGWRAWARLGAFLGGGLVVLYFLLFVRSRLRSREKVMQAAVPLLLILGALTIASRLALQGIHDLHADYAHYVNYSAWAAAELAILHMAACATLPWNPKESSQPFVPLLVIWMLALLIPQSENALPLLDRVVMVIVSPLVLAPGAAISHWRLLQREDRAERMRLDRQVSTMGGELSRARIVHDAMFPKPADTGQVQFDFVYVPIAEIGGDYVHLSTCRDSGKVTMTLLDVAGHGLAAALTVNRLFGELERIRAENRDAEPEEVMSLLNRYINLTMAPVNLYATGTCMMLDPTNGRLQWVNAGHPPALLRRGDGSVLELPGTTVLLGVLTYAEFDANQQETTLRPGDVAIAFTDGSYEARNGKGAQFGLERMRETAQFTPPPRSWTRFIAGAVAKHHEGHADDDVLIASLALRSLRVAKHSVDRAAQPVRV